MKSFDRSFLDQQAIPLEVAGTLRVLGEYRGRQELFARQMPQVLKTLRDIAIVQSTESSNRIEGVVVKEQRLQALMNQKIRPQNRSESEIVGYRDVLAKIHTSFEKLPVSPETILRFHKDMFQRAGPQAGIRKKRDNTIEERLPDGRWVTRFLPVATAETPFYMEHLCSRFNQFFSEGRIDRLLLIHAFVLDFLCIHPFTDGNGRISRLLTVLMLHQAGYDVGRYISLERLIEQSKETYYEVLHRVSEQWHEGRHRILPWWDYSLGVMIAAYKEFEDRMGTVRASRGAKTAWVREAVNNLPAEFSMSELARACPGVSRPMIRVVLEALRGEGKLEVVGVGRGAIWRKRR